MLYILIKQIEKQSGGRQLIALQNIKPIHCSCNNLFNDILRILKRNNKKAFNEIDLNFNPKMSN